MRQHTRARRSRLVAAIAVVAATVVLAASPATAQGDDRDADSPKAEGTSAETRDAEAKIVALQARPMAPVEPVKGSDGLVHLAYELELTNFSDFVLSFESIEVVDPNDDNAVLTTMDETAIADHLRLFGTETGSVLPARSGGILFVDVTLEPDATVPPELEHTFTYRQAPEAPTDGVVQVPGAQAPKGELVEFTGVPERVIRRQAVLLEPPLRGDRWFVANGCCADLTAHRVATLSIDGSVHVPERYAIDFVQLDEDGKLFEGPLDDNDSYDYFGEPIYSVAPGTVVGVLDGLPDQTPGKLPDDATVQTAGGNHVVVDIGSGRYAFYAHLQPGSLEVKVGDRVDAGDVIGRLGNSGNTDAAHLHFHVMDGPSPLTSNGLPFVFTTFTGRGRLENSEALQQDGAVADIDTTVDVGRHRREMPLNLDVIDFPTGSERE